MTTAARRAARRVEVVTPSGPGWVDLDRPSTPATGLLLIGHGAGGGVEAPDILAARRAALECGWAVARITQPYRVAGRRTPPAAPILDAAWLPIVARVRAGRGLRDLPAVFAGRSSGARVACRTASEGGAAGVIALAFPLHPPGRPDRSRADELALPTVAVLVVQGEHDPFGMPAPGPGRRVVVVPGDHSLRRATDAIQAAVTDFLGGLLAAP